MNIRRILRHLGMTGWKVNRTFPRSVLRAIEQAIADSEGTHSGQICFAVEGALDGASLLRNQSARERAIEVFSHLRVWDTGQNNGVLIYVLLADRDVEIVADRGINHHVPTHEWERICRQMETAFRNEQYEQGVLEGVREVARHLGAHFPGRASRDELPNQPWVL